MILKQSNRSLNLTTPLGEDKLLLTAFRGREEMSRLFTFDLEMISDEAGITAQQIVGKNVTFSVKLTDDSPRYFNGFVSRFSAGDEDREGRRNYRARVVPWFWFLTLTADCRIFQEQSAPDIIDQIFTDLGFSDFEMQLSGTHPTRTYCVQYRETDFNFVSRLLEEEGMFYFFKHDNGKHQLVIADKASAYVKCGEHEVDYPSDFGDVAFEDHLTSWEHGFEFRSGKFAHTDYNFETPATNLKTESQTVVKLPGNNKYEVYDYPGIYGETGDGKPLADVRMEELEVPHDAVDGTSKCKTFTPGGKFKVRQHRSDSEAGKEYCLTFVEHKAQEPMGYETGGSVDFDYENRFTCIPSSVVFRPDRITPKPFVKGVQTAVVTGPAGEEIHTDQYGRIKVQFFWDREGKKDENSSCWIRVAQNWAGKNWGIVFNPRIGQEVIIDFEEGDPDRPLVTGRVYNAEQMPPYALPAEQTKSTIKSRSSKGGGGDNFNEIRFEDKMGDEEMYIHAEKNQNTVVENDRTEVIGRDRSLDVGRDKSETVGRNKMVDVKANHTEQIGQAMTINVGSTLTETVAVNYSEAVGAAMQLTVGAALTITVGAVLAETVGAAKTEAIGGAKTEEIGQNKTVTVGNNLNETVKKDRVVTIAKDQMEKVGGKHHESVSKDYMLQAKKIQLTANDEINLKVGKAEIIMKKNGDITIKGKKINIKGSGDVVIKGSKIAEN